MLRLLIAASPLLWLADGRPGPRDEVLVRARNPKPDQLPSLLVWREPTRGMVYLQATFPNVPQFTCDTWCYESPVEFLGAEAGEGGRVRLRHRWKEHPEVIFVTTATPEPGAVDLRVTVELDRERGEKLPDRLMPLNACWQLQNAPQFASKPDPFLEFVKRCFIFTDSGLTFLHLTQRSKIPVRPDDDPYNNPPWVQMYTPVWRPVQKAVPPSWAGYSTDRFVYPVIGTVSRDKKYLAAIANDTASMMAQAWHDCLHNNAAWVKDANGEWVWRIRIYAMENDPEALLRRVGQDFPQAMRLKENRVPPSPAP